MKCPRCNEKFPDRYAVGPWCPTCYPKLPRAERRRFERAVEKLRRAAQAKR